MKYLGMPLLTFAALFGQEVIATSAPSGQPAVNAMSAPTTKQLKPGMYFVKYLGSLDKYIPIQTASLGDRDFGVMFVQSPVKSGKHILTLTIYDGAANEVRKSDVTVEARDGRLVFGSLHTFSKKNVAAGTWTWVSELDGEPQFTESIYVNP